MMSMPTLSPRGFILSQGAQKLQDQQRTSKKGAEGSKETSQKKNVSRPKLVRVPSTGAVTTKERKIQGAPAWKKIRTKTGSASSTHSEESLPLVPLDDLGITPSMVPATGTVEVSSPSPQPQESFVASGSTTAGVSNPSLPSTHTTSSKNLKKRSSSQGRSPNSAKSPYRLKWHVNQADRAIASSEVVLQVVEGICLAIDVKSFDKMAVDEVE
ncbi:hypothetical protein NE237_020766 [Protea cynaroides]|uniref:Uncharacterized protein n=1 Tax=Protea cynaroides TaxID=273540 RepID=A0A9Q0K2M0_9MAGN|nr:hypothetical protein NE237_020766 [Protea cynaroides]